MAAPYRGAVWYHKPVGRQVLVILLRIVTPGPKRTVATVNASPLAQWIETFNEILPE